MLSDWTEVIALLLVLLLLPSGWLAYSTHVTPGIHTEQRKSVLYERSKEFDYGATVQTSNSVFPVGSTLTNRPGITSFRIGSSSRSPRPVARRDGGRRVIVWRCGRRWSGIRERTNRLLGRLLRFHLKQRASDQETLDGHIIDGVRIDIMPSRWTRTGISGMRLGSDNKMSRCILRIPR